MQWPQHGGMTDKKAYQSTKTMFLLTKYDNVNAKQSLKVLLSFVVSKPKLSKFPNC